VSGVRARPRESSLKGYDNLSQNNWSSLLKYSHLPSPPVFLTLHTGDHFPLFLLDLLLSIVDSFRLGDNLYVMASH